MVETRSNARRRLARQVREDKPSRRAHFTASEDLEQFLEIQVQEPERSPVRDSDLEDNIRDIEIGER